MPVDQPLEIAVGVIAALYVIKTFIEWTPKIKMLLGNGKPSDSGQNAGDKTPEWWQIEHRRAVADVLGPMMINLNAILEKLTLAEREQTEALRELTQEIRDDRAEERGRRDVQRGGRK